MSILRFNIDLAFPESKQGVPVLYAEDAKGVKSGGILVDPILAPYLDTAIKAIRELKQYAVKINEGQANEEQTIKATLMISHHDDELHLIPDELAVEL